MSAPPSVSPRRDRAAILFADVHGYAQLMDRNEERTYERVSRSIRLMRSLIGDYGGSVMNVAGDGVLALFETAAQALRFAVTMQQELRKEKVWSADDEPVAFRIGINYGEVLVDDEANVQGRSVNVAARIQALAQPGGICVSDAVRCAAPDALCCSMRSLGPQILKSMVEPIEVFAVEVGAPPVPGAAARAGAPREPGQRFTEASVAVLPFVNLSDDPRNNHLCDGFTGDIITNLCRFRDLLVIARHSAFLFKGRGVAGAQIAARLGVRYLVTGGLQRSDHRLRLRVQLTEAATDRVIWSDRYNGDLRDLFAFQDDVIAMIAARLAVQISTAEQRRFLAGRPPKLRAYGLILRGQELSLRFRRQTNLHARLLFEQAAAIEPDYGRCYAGMSRTFNIAWRYHWTPEPQVALARAVDLANAAIACDSLDARGFGEFGFACLYRRRHESSLAAYERALELNPNDADILAEMGDALAYCCQAERGVELLRRAMRLNPYFPDWYLWSLGDAYFILGDYEQTIETLRRMRDQSEAHRLLAASHALLGHLPEARRHAELVLQAHPNFSIAHWQTVPPFKNPHDAAVLVEGLRRAGLP